MTQGNGIQAAEVQQAKSVVSTNGSAGQSPEPSPKPDPIVYLKGKVQQERTTYYALLSRRTQWRALYVPVVLGLVLLLTWLFNSQTTWLDNFRQAFVLEFPELGRSLGITFLMSNTLMSWLLVLVVTLPIFYWRIESPVAAQRRKLDELEDELRSAELHDAKTYACQEYQRLRIKTASAFLDNVTRYDIAKESLDKAGRILNKLDNPGEAVKAVSCLQKVDALIRREERELRDQRVARRIGIGFIAVYVGLLILAVLFLRQSGASSSALLPAIYVPASVIIWSAIGSLAAMLLRFEKTTFRPSLEVEIRWLIARPVLGIIMGCLSFVVLVCGLLVLTPMTSGSLGESVTSVAQLDGYQQIVEFGIFWVIAFLAGFSDKAYEGIIKRLLAEIPTDTLPMNIEENYVQKNPPTEATKTAPIEAMSHTP